MHGIIQRFRVSPAALIRTRRRFLQAFDPARCTISADQVRAAALNLLQSKTFGWRAESFESGRRSWTGFPNVHAVHDIELGYIG
jgi:hypothetical protein